VVLLLLSVLPKRESAYCLLKMATTAVIVPTLAAFLANRLSPLPMQHIPSTPALLMD